MCGILYIRPVSGQSVCTRADMKNAMLVPVRNIEINKFKYFIYKHLFDKRIHFTVETEHIIDFQLRTTINDGTILSRLCKGLIQIFNVNRMNIVLIRNYNK